MKQFARDRTPGKICLPIVETTVEKAIRAMARARRLADLVELRVDYMKNPGLELLLNRREIPCIITNRRREEGGRYRGDEKSRLAILRQAIHLGFDFVDVEMESGKSAIFELMENNLKTRLILSCHDFKKTPPLKDLRSLCRRMIRYGADVIKIVTLAQSWEDNLKVLSLIPYALERKKKVVALCMGEKGKMSRIFAPLMGGAWTYASLDKNRTSAPGQLTAWELKAIWGRLR
ncbi:MAG: type I 3-dehydroquinate dehydratase [Proteobacteria bacterium]|nr:type I 3-dehydroquinate dehydratase [Pseudomonadota bacterium]